jgi:hypothetical protein
MLGHDAREGFQQVGQPLLVHQPADADDQRRVGRKAQLGPHQRAGRRIGLERARIHAIWHHRHVVGARA